MSDDAVEDGEDFFGELPVPTYRWGKERAQADAMRFAAEMARCSAAYLDAVASHLEADNNFRVDRREVMEQAQQELNTITEGKEA